MDSSQVAREKRLLEEGREKLLERMLKAEKAGTVGSLPYTNYLVRQALDDLAEAITNDSKRFTKMAPGAYKKFALYLGSLDPKIAALRAILSALHVLLATGGADVPVPSWEKLRRNAGKAVYSEYLMAHFKTLSPPLFNSLLREYSKSMTRDESHLLKAFKAKYTNEGYEFPTWGFGDLEGVGSYLISELVRIGFLDKYSRTEKVKGKPRTVHYVCLAQELRGASLHIADIASSLPKVAGPMIEPPRDWQYDNTGGGYYTEGMQRLLPYAVQANGIKQISHTTIDAMNILQRRAWTIDKVVLNAVQEVARTRDFGDVVSGNPGPKPEWREDFTDTERAEWRVAAREWYTEKKVRSAKSRSFLRCIQEAVELSRYDQFWFAYFADFRNRKYCRAFSVSPQGNDLEKGLLKRINGKAIDTPEAVSWFKIHGANKYGLDKDTLPDRERWVDNNETLVLAVADDPIGNHQWTQADTPVQFLAWCLEYAGWKRDPHGYRSHLTLGQDGTCNGLQNFSALMRDEVGGLAVNLIPGPKPRDIYLDVAHKVTELLLKQPPTPIRDAWIKHGMNRKITKRTTMTLPYGCTRFACSTFIVDDYLTKINPPEIQKADYGAAALYLSHLIWKALDEVVVKAREVMEWLKGWAKHTAKAGLRVQWTTPNGLVVKSEYPKVKKTRIESVAFKSDITLYKSDYDTADAIKTGNAVAPNFVHSLDSSHMDRVIVAADAAGMEPVTIHDDFGVHPSDTEEFHKIIRQEFIAMYEGSNILQDMAEYSGYEVPPPDMGTLDLKVVLQSPYFFA